MDMVNGYFSEAGTLPRSTLYSINPIGVGTREVESLISHITRLSEAHCVFTGTLLNKQILPLMNKSYLNRYSVLGGNGFYDNSHTINGLRGIAEDFINIFSQLTLRSDIKFLTMITWANVINTTGLLRNNLAWCPLCLDDWMKNHTSVYIPLIWVLKDNTICLKHQILLQEVCPSCNKKVPMLHRKSIIGYCPYCYTWLGDSYFERNRFFVSNSDFEWRKWVYENIGDLLSAATELTVAPGRENLSNNISTLIKIFTEGNKTEFARLVGMPKATIYEWSTGRSIPSLRLAMVIAYKLGIMVKDLYTFIPPNIKIRNQVRIVGQEVAYCNLSSKRTKARYDYNMLRLQLGLSLQKEVPESMNSIAKRLDCNKRLLYRHFPEICKLISKRYQDYLKVQKKKRISVMSEEVAAAVDTIVQAGYFPSRRKVEEHVNKSAVLKEVNIKSSWKKKIHELSE